MKKVYPLLITDKLKECREYYVMHFGFAVVLEQDWYIHLIHEASGAELAFMAPNTKSQPAELHAAFGGEGMVYGFEVADARAEYERLLGKRGISMTTALKDEPWGQRHFIVRDPAGIYVDVVQQL